LGWVFIRQRLLAEIQKLNRFFLMAEGTLHILEIRE
jgi:hypothetical protein